MKAAAATPRRRALRRIALGIGAAAAAAAGFIAWGLHRPAATLMRGACAAGGNTAMSDTPNKKIVVTYATRAGSTAEVAQAIAERLCKLGFAAEVKPVSEMTSLQGVHAVVLGSAIRFGAWLPEMMKFIHAERAALQARPVAIFTLHMQGLDDSAAARETREKYVQPVRALINPRELAFFAGKVEPKTLSFFDRLAVRLVNSPLGDLRDWARIRAWADGLAQPLA
jgi:menaquinone-dependent protoporphyrinogen oxidase